ncbi:MAG: Fe(2+) transporter permease subunit FeoB [Gammaproteobacteria bacterium]|nr:Fe(2+) transporter permease subunit FeoB [Gammaproteobacteria bacterium]
MNKITVGLIGNPNSGKTTLFNALTGANQRVGNWPGVTVDRKSGFFATSDCQVEIVDLPGIYSLSVLTADGAIDERIAAEYMLSDNADVIVNVLDANNLERNLYLTTQLLELDIPVILAVNMQDVAKKRGISIDLDELQKALDCPVVGLIANKSQGIDKLKQLITQSNHKRKNRLKLPYVNKVAKALDAVTSQIKSKQAYFLAARLLEDDVLAKQKAEPKLLSVAKQHQQQISQELNEDADVLIADARYGMIHELIKKVVTESVHIRTTSTAAIDRIVLHRILGIPIFLGIMYLMFLFAANMGGVLQDYFQQSSNFIFVYKFSQLLSVWHIPQQIIDILTTGLGKGINTTLTFIPVLTAMFIFLAILEATGYMARAGFVMDRLMSAIGLPGKSFVPMLIGFGCNVPAIMAARTLENQRDRILTVMMTPFMSCTARLAIYAVFAAAIFPTGRQNIVFALYLIGILVAILTGLVLQKTILHGNQSPLVMELPPYHLPRPHDVLWQTWCRLKSFILKAGKVIIPACLIIGALNNIHVSDNQSLLASAGKKITPVLQPIGVTQNNWPATVGLIGGVVAKEIVIGTLNTLYAKDTPKQSAHSIYGQMYQRFGGQAAAFAYLLFVLLYFPCVPALATMFKELGWRWATFSMLWNTGIAYSTATLFYQVATFAEHPEYSTITITTVALIFLTVVFTMRKLNKKPNHKLEEQS